MAFLIALAALVSTASFPTDDPVFEHNLVGQWAGDDAVCDGFDAWRFNPGREGLATGQVPIRWVPVSFGGNTYLNLFGPVGHWQFVVVSYTRSRVVLRLTESTERNERIGRTFALNRCPGA